MRPTFAHVLERWRSSKRGDDRRFAVRRDHQQGEICFCCPPSSSLCLDNGATVPCLREAFFEFWWHTPYLRSQVHSQGLPPMGRWCEENTCLTKAGGPDCFKMEPRGTLPDHLSSAANF